MVSALDTTLPRFTVDALLLLLVAVNGYVGWRTGSIRRALTLVGLYTGFLAAYYTGNSFAGLWRKGDVVVNGWAFVVVMATVVIVFELLGQLFADRIARVAVLAFDRVAGLILGAVLGFFEVLAVFLVALAVGGTAAATAHAPSAPHDAVANAVRAATLSGQAIRAEPAVRAAFAPIIGTDLGSHLQAGTLATALQP